MSFDRLPGPFQCRREPFLYAAGLHLIQFKHAEIFMGIGFKVLVYHENPNFQRQLHNIPTTAPLQLIQINIREAGLLCKKLAHIGGYGSLNLGFASLRLPGFGVITLAPVYRVLRLYHRTLSITFNRYQ